MTRSTRPQPESSAAESLARAKAALESNDDPTLRALAQQLGEALAVVGDAAAELGDYLSQLPSDAGALESKLARQAQLRTLTRKYAADIDGVLQWAREARDRLAQLDVSEEALTKLERRLGELVVELGDAANDLSKTRKSGSQPTGQSGQRGAVGFGDGRRRVHHQCHADARRRR